MVISGPILNPAGLPEYAESLTLCFSTLILVDVCRAIRKILYVKP